MRTLPPRRIDVIERFLCGKRGDAQGGEDRIVVTDDFAAVIDGATSAGYRFSGKGLGAYAADVVANTLEALDAEVTADEFVGEATRRIASFIRARKLPVGGAINPAASAAVYSRRHHEVWFVGDCQARVGEQVYRFDKTIDRVLSDVRALVLELERAAGTPDAVLQETDPGRVFIQPLLERQAELQNRRAGGAFDYHALDGSHVPSRGIVVASLSSADREVVLGTDGYPALLPTLEATEEALAAGLEADPLCEADLRSTKGLRPDQVSFDDRAYLRFTV